MRNKNKIILDTPIWINHIAGRKLDELAQLILDQNLIVFSCNELEEEIGEVLAKEEFEKIIHFESFIYLDFIRSLTTSIPLSINNQEYPDNKHNYLLALARQTQPEFFVTGDHQLVDSQDKDLKVVSFTYFRQLFGN